MIKSLSNLWKFFNASPAIREAPPPTWWRVAYCSAYNSPPPIVVDVYTSYYSEAVEEAEMIPKKYWVRDTSVKWAEDWPGMQAWKLQETK